MLYKKAAIKLEDNIASGALSDLALQQHYRREQKDKYYRNILLGGVVGTGVGAYIGNHITNNNLKNSVTIPSKTFKLGNALKGGGYGLVGGLLTGGVLSNAYYNLMGEKNYQSLRKQRDNYLEKIKDFDPKLYNMLNASYKATAMNHLTYSMDDYNHDHRQAVTQLLTEQNNRRLKHVN